MARRRILPRGSHLQVGSRLVASCLIAVLALSQPIASAETKKPTPKPTVKASAKASTKAPAKATTKASAKPTTKATTKPTTKASAKPSATSKTTSKPSVKATPKKSPAKKVVKKKPLKKIRITPSPKPSWPPKGYSAEGEVYAKIPTAKELVGLISANKTLARQVKDCEKFICGAVQVASAGGCLWWEVISNVLAGDGKKLGELTTLHGASKEQEIKTLLTISPESNANGGSAKIVSVLCHHVDKDPTRASVTYQKS